MDKGTTLIKQNFVIFWLMEDLFSKQVRDALKFVEIVLGLENFDKKWS